MKKRGGKGKIHEHPNAGKGNFAANPQNINRKGRPRKLVSGVIKDLTEKGIEEVSVSQVKSCYLMLINLEEEELHEISNDESQPILVKVVSRSILSGKGFDIIESMFDRVIGKPEQTVDLKTDDIKTVVKFTRKKRE